VSDLAARIRSALAAAGDETRAPAQQAYMKSEMPFRGVALPEVRRLTTREAKGVSDAGCLRVVALELWDGADYREERYAALALLASKPNTGDRELIPLIEHMVRTGRWWDYTDELAHRVADLHDADPVDTAILVRTWSTDPDLWMRRIAIISQLGRRDRLDAALLADVIRPNLGDDEFFIRKAIGWALREYARVDPAWVREYADGHPLSPLSRREALKHL
jgi:3-methyladenine DNA glycosylase AlkD